MSALLYYLGRFGQIVGMWILLVDLFTAGPMGPNPRLFAVGVAGVFIETHQDPDKAPSDGPNMIPLKDMEPLLERLMEFDALAKTAGKSRTERPPR